MAARKNPILSWRSFKDGEIASAEKGLWVVRMGVIVDRPARHKKYEDSFVSLTCMTGGSKAILGYSLKEKRDFHKVFVQENYMSLLSNVGAHCNPCLVYEDQKVRLYKFNSNKNPSYWFLVRYRPSEK